MRIVFFGSPDFALPTLRRLIESEHEIVGVFTQPDRPAGRGRKLVPPPVKTMAMERGLPVFQPKRLSKRDGVEQLRRLQPDVGVLAAYGQILSQEVLDVPPLGILNVHASLLPRWRGAAPVAAAILAGDRETGATIMKIVRELDAGPILGASRLVITPNDTTGTLTERIAEAGAALLMELLPAYLRGERALVEQDNLQATYAPVIRKSDALIHWAADDAATIQRKVKAYNPWPVAYSYLSGKPLRILDAVALEHHTGEPPGTIFAWSGVGESALPGSGFGVTTRQGDLGVERVQYAGGKEMSAAAFLNGHREIVGMRLTSD